MFDGNKVSNGAAKHNLGGTNLCVPVWGIAMGEEGPLEVVRVQGASGGYVLPEHSLCTFNTQLSPLVAVGKYEEDCL